MKMIENIEIVTNIYENWRPSDVCFLKALDWSIDRLGATFYCQLREDVRGWPDLSGTFFEVTMVFRTVTNLRLNLNGPGLHQLSGFDILDVAGNGMEKINFQIEDYENESMNFFCGEIEIIYLSNPKKLGSG